MNFFPKSFWAANYFCDKHSASAKLQTEFVDGAIRCYHQWKIEGKWIISLEFQKKSLKNIKINCWNFKIRLKSSFKIIRLVTTLSWFIIQVHSNCELSSINNATIIIMHLSLTFKRNQIKYSLLMNGTNTYIQTMNDKQKTIKLKRDSQKQMQRHNIQMYQILDGFSSDTTLPLLLRKTLEEMGGCV